MSDTDLSGRIRQRREQLGLSQEELAARLGLPPGMSSGALLEALRLLISYEEYLRAVGRAPETGNGGNEENAGGTF